METSLVPKACPDALPELAAFLAPFSLVFRRAESRESLERYVTGLLTDLSRKNCETIAAAIAGTSIERLQHLLTDATWNATMLDEVRVRSLAARSPHDGILALDDSGLPKQGKHSVGVQRQYCGALGKIANCQVMVSAEFIADEPAASTPLHWPVSGRLFLPERWADDPERRKRAHVPDRVTFHTKPQLALALIDDATTWAVPFRYVVADAGYGDNPTFLDGLEERHLAYVCAVERSFGMRLPEEVRAAAAAIPEKPTGKGRPKLPRAAPLHTADSVATAQPERAWQTITWRAGTRGPLRKQFLAIRVHRATGNPATGPHGRSVRHGTMSTGSEGWLLAERPASGEEGERKWYYANLPAETPLERLATVAHARWLIEQFYEDAKGECGLDAYQGRRWDGFHRHLALGMLTYSFLMIQRHTASDGPDGGLSPLRTLQLSGGAPAGPLLAVLRPGALAHRHRLGLHLPPTSQLTK
jgi:SRSO17 transposase